MRVEGAIVLEVDMNQNRILEHGILNWSRDSDKVKESNSNISSYGRGEEKDSPTA